MKKNDILLKTYEVMDILKITRDQLYRLMKDGEIKAINIGRGESRADWRIKQSDLDKFLKYDRKIIQKQKEEGEVPTTEK